MKSVSIETNEKETSDKNEWSVEKNLCLFKILNRGLWNALVAMLTLITSPILPPGKSVCLLFRALKAIKVSPFCNMTYTDAETQPLDNQDRLQPSSFWY